MANKNEILNIEINNIETDFDFEEIEGFYQNSWKKAFLI